MLKALFYFSILFTTFSQGFINVEPPVIGEKEGLNAEIALGAKYSSGNSDSSSTGLAIKGQYSAKEWLVYFISTYSYGESNGNKDTNDGLFHLRYVHNIAHSAYDYELFLQTQFNEFQAIKKRNLIGANIRRNLDVFFEKFYLGIGLFYSYMEPDTITGIDPIYRRVKINSHISFLKKINEALSLTYSGYYQPNIEGFSDFRVSQILQFNTTLTDHLILSFEINHNYNATPYHEIERNDIRSTINLRYEL